MTPHPRHLTSPEASVTTTDPAAPTDAAARTDDVTATDDVAASDDVAGTRAAAQAPPRSAAERLARKALLIEGADPKALMDLKGSLVISAVRCVLTYALIPAMTPLISWSGVVATPLAIVLTIVAMGMATNSLRRVWLADWHHRWAYTGFIAVVLALLGITLVFDVNSLLG
jgi:hypothetical protein